MWKLIIHTLLLVAISANAQKDPHFWDGRNTIIQLFEWKWSDIAAECERFLQYKGYGGVQISPPNENLVISPRPWWERYQPVSYNLITRSGDEAAFVDMTRRCNNVGVRIYVDAVINHMTAGSGTGIGGNSADAEGELFPGVPYGPNDFNPICYVNNFEDPNNIRNCRLGNLLDLNQGSEYVRQKIVDYMNHLIALGVAGFRVDAAKHMWPVDLREIYARLWDLNVDYGFAPGSRAFIFQEVVDTSVDAVSVTEYTDFGTIIEFKYSGSISNVFRGNDKLTYLVNWGVEWGFVEGIDAVAFVDNHDNQRVGEITLTYKEPKPYKMAIAFMLAHPYGTTRIISSFAFDNNDQGPPADGDGNIISPGINPDDTCSNGYVCEHRWREIYNMVGFRNAVMGTGINDWWSNGDQQIAFCRGDRGFIAFTNWGDLDGTFQTCLTPGVYCDVITGSLVDGSCSGKTITVEDGGWAHVTLFASEMDGVVAIHANARQS